MENKEPVRITTSFVILHDRYGEINPGIKRYVFPTVSSARNFWVAAGQRAFHCEVEKVFPNSKADMISRINDIVSEAQYDEA